MGSQDEEDAEDVADPGERVQEVNLARRVLGDEEVEEGQRDRVAGEHVVTAGTNTLEGHSSTRPENGRNSQQKISNHLSPTIKARLPTPRAKETSILG